MKIAHLTSAHRRYDTRIFLKECTSLAGAGYDVYLVVADGNGDEKKDGVNICDVGAYKGRFERMFHVSGRIFKKSILLNADVYHIHDPELMPIGLRLKKKGKKVIFDIHENTDLQILTKEWIPLYFRKWISVIFKLYEGYACKMFDCLIVPQVSMESKFSKFSKTEIIANFPSVKSHVRKRENLSRFHLFYSGGLGKARGLFNMLDLINVLATIDDRYQLKLAGPILSEDLVSVKTHPGWKNTKYLGVLSSEEIYKEYKENTIGLILFNNVGQYYMAYSLKLFEYMQNGMIVLMPNFGDWLKFNDSYNVGFNVDSTNVSEIVSVINGIDEEELASYSMRNQKLAADEFTWLSQEKKLINIYKELMDDR